MQIKLFGKTLFESRSSKAEQLWGYATASKAMESKYLPDFYTTGNGFSNDTLTQYVSVESIAGGGTILMGPTKKKTKKVVEEKKKITPKGVYEMKMLNDLTFKVNTDPVYVDKQLADFKEKLGFVKSEEYDISHGVNELTSIVMRLENRKKYPEVKAYFEEFPYTTSSKIDALTKAHTHLKTGQIAQFIADMPKEAIDVMRSYNENTQKVCGKQAVFYIIADQKDFKKTNVRRDPILLAQSPFGHFWQILGAWDEEMMFLEDL